jgi:hypothetical protein
MSGSFPQRPVFKDNGMVVTAGASTGTTLSAYIEQAEEHSTVAIPPGTYTESLVIKLPYLLVEHQLHFVQSHLTPEIANKFLNFICTSRHVSFTRFF